MMTEEEWHTKVYSGRMLEYSKRITSLTWSGRCRKYRLAAVAVARAFLASGSQEKTLEDTVLSLIATWESKWETVGAANTMKEAVLAAGLPMGREADPNWNPVLLALFDSDPSRALSERGPYRAVRDVCALTQYGRVKSEVVFEGIQCGIIRDIFGNPFRPVVFAPQWRSDTAVSLAKHIYEARDFAQMPILADALQDAGCDNADVLIHCRDANQIHVRGCWVVDGVLGKS
jgi:hypothetical protein